MGQVQFYSPLLDNSILKAGDCLWLYHAARLGRPTDESANGYASLDASGKESSEARSLAVAFLSSRPMLHLGELSYGIYICQLGAFQTIAWLHNLDKPSSMKPASWLNHDAASWGTFNLEAVSLVEVLALLLGVVQLFEWGFARLHS